MAKVSDTLHRFLIENANVRGELVHLDSSWRSILACADYPPVIRQVLGNAMAAVALMSATIKFSGKLTLQVRGSGPVNLLVMQATADGAIRGLAQWMSVPGDASLKAMFGDGQMLITIDPGQGREQYQGIVALDGETLADALSNYFVTSEQLPTAMHLYASDVSAGGLLLQKLPGECSDSDGWNRARKIADTISEDEVLSLDAESILHRLYHQEALHLFDGKPMRFECSCSREKTAGMVKSLGQSEVDDIIEEQGAVEVSCEFCSTCYRFDAVDAAQLFVGQVSTDSGKHLH